MRISKLGQICCATLLLLGWSHSAACAANRSTNSESLDVAALTARAKKSVAIVTHYGRDGKQNGVGTGFIVSEDGLIATCLHVIDEARPIRVELTDGRRFEAIEVFASDRKLDLAVIRIAATNLPVLKLGDSAALKQGTPVIAIGNPLGLEHSVVQGVVSAIREIGGVDMIQLAIPIEPGNSGGPLLDRRGRVQGLLNMKSAVTANLGFALPASALRSLLDRPNPVPIARWLLLGALDPGEWQPVLGARWTRKAGRIQVENPGEGFGGRALCLWQKNIPALPYEISVTVKLDEESGAAGLVFASDSGNRHYGFYPTAGQIRLTRFDGPDVYSWTILKEFKTPHYKAGEWNTLRVRVETNRIVGYVNGEQVMESNDAQRREGRVGLAKFRDTRAQFKNFYLGTNPPATRLTIAPEIVIAAATGLAAGKSVEEIAGKLKTTDEPARNVIRERARQLEFEAQQMRRLADTMHARSVEAELVALLNREEHEVSLFHAALLVAKLDNPELDIEAYRAEMNRLCETLRREVEGSADDSVKQGALNKFLFVDQGFHGSRTDFYNRANSYMNQVMDDREGLPITLAILYLELAWGIGLTNVAGVPLPTRFMVRFKPAGGLEQIIDVFDGGKVLTRSEAVELVAENVDAIADKDFQPARKREIILRMLNNLLGLAQREGNVTDSLRYLDCILAVNPNSISDRLIRARMHVRARNNTAAKADLRWLLDQKSEGLDLERLTEWYDSL